MIYLDNAAATPIDDEVVSVMAPYYQEKFFNPSATYLPARQLRKEIDEARASIAKWLGAKSTEIVFTAGATEANNLAIRGVMAKHPKGNIIISAIEHESIIEPAKNFKYKTLGVKKNGLIELEELAAIVDDETVLVSIIYANNEIGTVQSISKIGQLLKSIRTTRKEKGNPLPLYLHTDAAQAANYLDLHTARLGVDLMTVNGSKIYGPKQTGFLFVRSGVDIEPQILGGGQELGRRNGTENVSGIIGLAKALEKAQLVRSEENKRLQQLQSYFIDRLTVEFPKASINGTVKTRLPNNVHFTLPGQDNERLVMALDEHEIYCATGSACSAAKGELSHVLSAIGLSRAETTASLRVSMGRQTTKNEIDEFISTLKKISQ
jgi:cysteine desulfurase